LHLLSAKVNKTSKNPRDYIIITAENYMRKDINDVINGPTSHLAPEACPLILDDTPFIWISTLSSNTFLARKTLPHSSLIQKLSKHSNNKTIPNF